MWLSFSGAGRLVGVDLYRRGMRPDDVRAALGAPGLSVREQYLSARMQGSWNRYP
jgi:hypothetical protein